MGTLSELLEQLGGRDARFGVLAESNTYQLTVVARNTDVAVGDLFLLPCTRGSDRFYVFRTTQYANILSRTLEMNDVARNKLTMPDSYLAHDLQDEQLIELRGMVLGYAERESDGNWTFHRPRRLPGHLTDVYKVDPAQSCMPTVVNTLMRSQLGQDGLFIGNLLAGEVPLAGVEVHLPSYALSHHIGIFGRTGCGKSNLMMVFLRSILAYNRRIAAGQCPKPRCSILAIDPHDEFRAWHSHSGGVDGIRGIINSYSNAERQDLVEPFYYLSARDIGDTGLERHLCLSRADLTPQDLASVLDMTDQQLGFAQRYYTKPDMGERWITQLLLVATESAKDDPHIGDFHPGTIDGVKRRLSFVHAGSSSIFTPFDPDAGFGYKSSLPDIICALEKGRLVIVDTSLMSELEQFFLTTLVARLLFTLRKTLRSAQSREDLLEKIPLALGCDDAGGLMGMRSLAEALIARIEASKLPYLNGDEVRPPDEMPYVNIVVEEAPSVLNPQRIKFGSVFRDISRQGRKFGIGLTVISQQVTEIDQSILTQINTELTMALGNEEERRAAIRNASCDLMGFERELQVMSKGEAIASASYRDIPLPLQAPPYDTLTNAHS